MQFSEHWLRTFVNPPLDSGALAHTLTMAGLEVEEARPAAPEFSGVVVAHVLDVAPHPNADRLRVTRVDVGQRDSLTIVCGAPNVAAGQKVPCAMIGAQLPGGLSIAAATMRGVQSQGMLCSAKELQLAEDASGLMLLPADAPVGQDLRVYLALDDRVLTLKLTPNRADCLGMLGLARDVAAITATPLHPLLIDPIPATTTATFPVSITDVKACGRFASRVIQGVNAKAPTPPWMRQRLERSGVRSISAIVDVTNYVMLELNRPLHAYDLRKLQAGIDVRWARPGEKLTLLNGETITLDPDMAVITDARGPIGLAGIMGGETTEVDLSTVDVFLESAFFPPDAIAGRSRRLGFASDAGHRFERGVDYANNVDGIERATRLILDLCGGEAGPVVDTVAQLPTRSPVTLRKARYERLVGVSITAERIVEIFSRLGFACAPEGENFVVTPPSYRFDIEIEEDLIEEIARIDGYEKLPAQPARARLAAIPLPERQRPTAAVKRLLTARDYQEVISFSFVPQEWERDFAGNETPVRITNPIASQFAVMRSTLVGSLIDTLRTNLNRKAERVRLFEVGRRFLHAEASEAAQPVAIAGLVYGYAANEQWGEAKRRVDFYDAKGDVEALFAPRPIALEPAPHPALHPGRSARVLLAGNSIGWIGEVHPRWLKKYELAQAPVVFEIALAPLLAGVLPRGQEVSKFPSVRRDLAFVVDENVSAQAMLDALREAAPPFVGEIRLFDVYRGANLPAGKKSLAILVLMQDTQSTLTDAEISAAYSAMATRVEKRFGAALRQ